MARQVNGHLGTFATISNLTTKFPPSESIGCSANVGTEIPYTKAWCNGTEWSLVNAPAINALATGPANQVALATFAKIKPVGVNSYDLVRRPLITPGYDQEVILDWVQEAGGNMVRVMWPAAFASAEYSTYVFSAGTPPSGREMQDSDFRDTFLAASDSAFNSAAERGISLLACLCWSPDGVTGLFGETPDTGLRVGSQTHDFMLRLTRWFARRYGTNMGLGAISWCNEALIFEINGAGWPTAAELGGLFESLASEFRSIAPRPFVTSDLVFMSQQLGADRDTYVSTYPYLQDLVAGLDVIGLHAYAKGPSQSGYAFSGANKDVTPATANTAGFEGFGSMACALRSLADSFGKPLFWTETGVPNDVESDSERAKKDRCLRELLRYGQAALLWDVADLASPQANQVVWQIRPGTTRGDTFKAVALEYNSGRVSALTPVLKGGGSLALHAAQRPASFFSSTRTGGAIVSVTSTAAMTSATQSVAFWIRRDAALNNFEVVINCRGAGNTSGFVVLEGATAGTNPLFMEFRGAAGGAGNISGLAPIPAVGEWVHMAVTRRTLAGVVCTEVWINGMYWETSTATSTYVGIPNGTTLEFCGDTSGAPVSLQDVCIAPYMTQEDIWAHMRGETVPGAVLHLRALNNGVVDISRSNVAVTVGAGVTVTGF